MNEHLSLYNNPDVQHCRKCLLDDFCGSIPKRLGEVLADMNQGNVEQLQCDECTLSQVHFDELVTALYVGALLGDDLESI